MQSRLSELSLENIPLPVVLFERDSRPVFVNNHARELLSQLRGLGPPLRTLCRGSGLVVAGTDWPYPPERWPVGRAARGESCQVDDVAFRFDRREHSLEVRAAPVKDDQGEITHVISVFQDTTLRKSREDALARLADRDPITGLPTRDSLEVTFAASLERMRRRDGHGVACLLLRVPRFEELVDRHGVDVGDQVLAELSQRIKDSVRRVDHPHRYGGHAFMIVCEAVRTREQAERLARRLCTDLGGGYQTSGGLVALEVNAGVSFTMEPTTRPGRLARLAGESVLEEELGDR